jgi:AAA domain
MPLLPEVAAMTDAFASAYMVEAAAHRDSGDSRARPLSWGSDSGDSGDRPARQRTAWTAAELLATDFPEPRWAVPGIVPEGVTLLAGPPKVGKSWLTLGLGLAVAAGGQALGAIDVPAGQVLYLALEDTPRRMQARLRKMLGPDPAPDAMTVATACPPLTDGGDVQVGRWLAQHPAARLVVVDVFARLRGPTPPSRNAYDADYGPVARVKAVADAHGVAVVLVVHTRKREAEDFLETVSGTYGLAGAADAVAVLRRPRGKADGVLQVTGRDVEEATHALTFGADLGTWQMLDGPASEHLLADTRATILGAVRLAPGAGPRQLADATALDYSLVKQTVRRMVEDAQLATDGNGHYYPSPPPPESPLSPLSPLSQEAEP